MQELKERRIWICWNSVTVGGRKTKKPISAQGTATGTDKPHADTWVTYAEAEAAAEKNGYAGVGFVIPEGCFFLDIDHRDIDDPLVKLLLERFDSYAEKSVSGNGIHIYGKCDPEELPTYIDSGGKVKLSKEFYTKNPHNDLELYIGGITNRFAVYTGNAVLEAPLRDCTRAVITTLDKDMRRKGKTEHFDDDPDGTLLETVCALHGQKNGNKFTRLYTEGNTTGYKSASEADAALCAIIAFRTGPNPDMIDKIFRNSALYREKWERDDYRERTIAAGIEACRGTFYNQRPPFIIFNARGIPVVAPPLLAKYIREHLDYILVRDNGKHGILKYVYQDGAYRLYADNMLQGIIKQYIAEYDETLITMRVVTEVLQLLSTDLNYVKQDDLDADETLINFQNGLLRVTATDLELLHHAPEILSTIQIPCEWPEEPPETPVFDAYMHTLTDGDAAIEHLLMEFIGACISNIKGWRMKKALFLVGDGDTGKSQLKSLVEKLLGRGNFIGIDLREIEARFGTGAIYNTRLAGSSDMSFLTVDELKTFKKITGGDSLYAEFKGQQAFEFTYNGLLWFCMNRLPKFGGDDGQWVYDRIMVIRCPNVIPKETQDRQLLDKMYAERQGIVCKAVKALQTVIANGYRFSEPESVASARKLYMTENNTVISFFKECMRPWPKGKINPCCTTGRIYRVYKAWCQDNNNGYAKTVREFREVLENHLGIPYANMITRRKGNSCFKDYCLTLEAKEQYRIAYGGYLHGDDDDFLSEEEE